MLSIKTVMLSLAILGYSSAHAESSINCSKSRFSDEKAICRSVELQKQDVKMTTLFEVSGHLMAMGGRGAMQDQQVEWWIGGYLSARAVLEKISKLSN